MVPLFFIDNKGTFMTAAHVFRDAADYCKKFGGSIGLMVRRTGDSKNNYLAKPAGYSAAPGPFDVGVGFVPHDSMSCFVLPEGAKIWIWQDVHTMGYAESAVSRSYEATRTDVRALKGYVVRKLPAGHFLVDPHPECFELSFVIPTCMSGSPLVLRWTDKPPSDAPFPLIGVCVGVSKTMVGTEETETYGLAHSIFPLADWKPECLEGRTSRTIDDILQSS